MCCSDFSSLVLHNFLAFSKKRGILDIHFNTLYKGLFENDISHPENLAVLRINNYVWKGRVCKNEKGGKEDSNCRKSSSNRTSYRPLFSLSAKKQR